MGLACPFFPPLGGVSHTGRQEGTALLPPLTLPSCLQLVLRSINSSKSAYASVTYYSRFFESFDVFDRSLLQAGMLMKVKMLCAAKLALALHKCAGTTTHAPQCYSKCLLSSTPTNVQAQGWWHV